MIRLALSLTTLLSVCGPITTLAEDETSPTARHFEIPRASGPIRIDGVLDEPAWAEALVFDLPYEWSPGDNVTPPVETEFLATYDDNYLYAAWRAHDPNPGDIRAHLMDRDAINTFVQDDHVLLMIDTFNDERRGFQFRVNPLGVQADAVFSQNEGIEDFSFDMIWDSAGRIDEKGYVVEIAIPLDQIRFPRTADVQTWGFDVGRSYPRNVRHRIASSPRDRGNACVLCQADKVEGFENLEPGRNLEITPTLTGNRTDTLDTFPDGDLTSEGEDVDFGLSMRWGITPNLSLNAALNPDFSQVEADVAQLQINERFALFFPEKRPFFLEGIDIFSTPLRAVFTRSVVDPDWGLKLTGKEGRNAFGVFAADDRVNSFLIPSNQGSAFAFLEESVTSGVVRYRRDVGSRGSTVGALLTGRQGDDYSNDVYGADAFLRFDNVNTLRMQWLHSETRYPDELASGFGQDAGTFGGDAYFIDYDHNSRNWIASLAYRELEPGFRADSGFMPRVDVKDVTVFLRRVFWGEDDDWYTQASTSFFGRRIEDAAGQLTDENLDFSANFSGPRQSFLEVAFQRNKELFQGVLHEGMERYQFFFQIQPGGALKLSLFGDTGESVDFSNNQKADIVQLAPTAELKLGRHVNIQLEHSLRRLEVPEGELFEANLSQLRLVYNFNVRTFVRGIFQYLDLEQDPALFPFPVERQEKELFTQLLFSYKVNPQTLLFLGYSDTRLGTDDVSLTQTGRTFFLKVGYAWTL